MTSTSRPEDPTTETREGLDGPLEERMRDLAGTPVPDDGLRDDGSDDAGRPGIASRDLARAIARAADERKATDIVTLDLRHISDVTDFFVIATAANNRQADAIVDRVNEVAKGDLGVRPLSVEGRAGLRWVLMDFGSVVFHVFQQEVRDYYRLERLWGDAPRVLFGLEGEAPYEPPLPDDSIREAEETEEDLD